MINIDDLRKIVAKAIGPNGVMVPGDMLIASAVAAAVKRDDAKRCSMYIQLLDSCGHLAAADELRHLQRHFIEDADDLAGKETT